MPILCFPTTPGSLIRATACDDSRPAVYMLAAPDEDCDTPSWVRPDLLAEPYRQADLTLLDVIHDEGRQVVKLVTLQWSVGGLFDGRIVPGLDVCLVTAVAAGGTPGPTLCGRDRFAEDAPGWSVGGGITGGDDKPCTTCAEAARTRYPGVPITGTFAGLFTAASLKAVRS